MAILLCTSADQKIIYMVLSAITIQFIYLKYIYFSIITLDYNSLTCWDEILYVDKELFEFNHIMFQLLN